MKSKIFVCLLFLALLIVLAGFTQKAFAVDVPNFPLCTAPRGEVIARYTSGTHGVPGDTATYLGEDVVYKVNENQVLQCLCTIDGEGIQTNWWQFEALSDDQMDILKSQGWIFVQDGSLWGLKAVPYFAKNAGFACGVSAGVGGEGQVLGVSLAPTGNASFILGVILTGIALVLIGLLLRLNIRRRLR